VKYYDNLRLVYDIQTRLEEWTQAGEQERAASQSRAETIDITPRASDGGGNSRNQKNEKPRPEAKDAAGQGAKGEVRK
jgi:hypothetical protein